MPSRLGGYLPALVLAFAGLGLLKVRAQDALPLRAPLGTIPAEIGDYTSQDLTIGPEERRIAGMSEYLMRLYTSRQDSTSAFSVYVGYYDQQVQGKSIHSPKNCLPGAGWEPLSAGVRTIQAADGATYTVNRYEIGNGRSKALVYYWYQGRGRITANEYRVKYELLRDKAVEGRSEEALVRIVVPLGKGADSARVEATAERAAAALIGPIFRVLPEAPPQT